MNGRIFTIRTSLWMNSKIANWVVALLKSMRKILCDSTCSNLLTNTSSSSSGKTANKFNGSNGHRSKTHWLHRIGYRIYNKKWIINFPKKLNSTFAAEIIILILVIPYRMQIWNRRTSNIQEASLLWPTRPTLLRAFPYRATQTLCWMAQPLPAGGMPSDTVRLRDFLAEVRL